MTGIFAMGLTALLILTWADFLRARERAVRIAEITCRRQEAKLLDDTVELRRLGTGRDERGRLRLRRHYAFELTRDGRTRERGHLILLAGRTESVRLEDQTGRNIFEDPAGHQG
ncbi:hypothetical protein AN478_07975 [Thiohalorhabdus denitrificans]|nr:hypothetical protein AN478_07975 [Thiohalorhabdus denitrificans]